MSSFTFLIAVLFCFYLTSRGRAETGSYSIPVNDLLKHCSFDLNGYVYNLCPLMGSPKVVDVPGESQDGKLASGRYILALGGFRRESDVKNPSPGCNEETWVCSTTKIEGTHRPVIQKGENSNLIIKHRGDLDHGPSKLQMTFHGAKKKFDIVMLCSEVEQVQLINVGDDTLRFMWTSRHGCPRNSTRWESTLNASTDGEQKPSEEDREGDDKLLPSDSRKARKSIAFVIALIVLSAICGSALVSSVRARHFVLELLRKVSYTVVPILAKVGLTLRPIGQSINSLTSKAMSSVRFRQGDDDLVRWAQEDMALDSDIMVNGSGRTHRFDEESWDGSDEYIPLTTSPRFGTGRRIPSYGSTPDGPTVQEGAVMGRMRKYLKI